ncbi:hypothetical protein A2686_02630 [Candidatus Woesebacteria bacterium RIFCSPHIGHO2_01_FULL_38_10]|uniref:Uncharacterized protein n=1 Tax=Candidatus Woesebacteria bacterium RIFCSPLOWO2_01_FULL_39_10b TaxID=1802517 RepID=A0A1F8B8V0_9BACT|nr:MAG: hypothetical protein A2686_02630 [Candidatus Woesebacteria bacterium RIFCSPHIGHO2_01_FULL_38_10]OGM60463.1 MAG: hypothetical protein A2892_00320 [Candidatus Woesebacteria bacterium RIFCSPLOWO2_01_FULL_39_10b]
MAKFEIIGRLEKSDHLEGRSWIVAECFANLYPAIFTENNTPHVVVLTVLFDGLFSKAEIASAFAEEKS